MLKAASDIDSSNYYYLATLGAIYVQNKDLPSAVRLHESLIKKFPTKEDSYISLMEIYYPRGQVDKVMELADKLEKATLRTISDGVMTGDLAAISALKNKKTVDTETFLEEINARLVKSL